MQLMLFCLFACLLSLGLLQWLSDKESSCSAGDAGDVSSIPGSGRPPEGRHGNPLQYSCLKNPMDRGAWRAVVREVTKSWTWLSEPTGVVFRFPWPLLQACAFGFFLVGTQPQLLLCPHQTCLRMVLQRWHPTPPSMLLHPH